MKIKIQCPLLIVLCSSILMLSGCMSPGKNMIPQGGSMTMTQIYQNETGNAPTPISGSNISSSVSRTQQIRGDVQNISQNDTQSVVGYASTSGNMINTEFKALPDPEIPIYIYPHFVRENDESYPKPAMMTAFFLYKRNHFALPNEVY